ncbi:MAG: hypothetical protein KGL90_14095 [Burkholderiales bacterium]|nr:hypothetical protein [Burkholderiales bacterium]
MSTHPSVQSADISLYDARPFFEKALQFGVQHGILDQPKLDTICNDAPKGMVQIASYFGSEFLLADLDKAKSRMVNLVSLFLEDTSGGDLRRAAECLRDQSFLSCSKGGSTMLKHLIAMPQTCHFGMNERKGFTDEHIPQLAKWTLKSLQDYRHELAQRTHAAQVMDAAIWLADELGTDDSELEAAGADAEAVIRTALLTLAIKRTEMPNWSAFEKMIAALRQSKTALTMGIPADLPGHLRNAVEQARQSVLLDLPKIRDASLTTRKLFNQSPVFMGRYFWVEDGLSEVVHHDRSASAAWKKATAGHSDEGSLLTLFLCVATSSTPKTLLTERSAATLVRKIRKSGLQADLARQYIMDHAPVHHQGDYVQLWQSFVEEALPTLKSDMDHDLKDALALLRRECVVQAAQACVV